MHNLNITENSLHPVLKKMTSARLQYINASKNKIGRLACAVLLKGIETKTSAVIFDAFCFIT